MMKSSGRRLAGSARRLVWGAGVALGLLGVPTPAQALDQAGADVVIAAVNGCYEAFRAPPGRDPQVDRQLFAQLRTARTVVLEELRGLPHEGIIRNTALLLSAYQPLISSQPDAEFSRIGAWFLNRSTQILVSLESLALRASIADARRAAPAYNLLVAVRLLFLRRAAEITLQPLPGRSLVTITLSPALQMNYDLVGAAAFLPRGAAGTSATASGGKLSRHGDDEVVRLVREAMRWLVRLGWTDVVDRIHGSGTVSDV